MDTSMIDGEVNQIKPQRLRMSLFNDNGLPEFDLKNQIDRDLSDMNKISRSQECLYRPESWTGA